jgi:uncharacterized SAM-binding protein YcdF (DUF218 family)
MRRLFKLIFQLIAAAIFLFLCIAAVIVFDGLNDQGQKADCALVTGQLESPWGKAAQPALDRTVKLYNDGEFPVIIVAATRIDGAVNEPDAMAKYLESHGVPANAIFVLHHGGTTAETAQAVATLMKSRMFQSVMIVTDYYSMTRIKLALTHEGVEDVEKAHVGMLQKEDALKIGEAVASLCDYVGHVYLLPAAEKAKEEAQVGLDKASVDAQQAKDKVNKSLDNMAK